MYIELYHKQYLGFLNSSFFTYDGCTKLWNTRLEEHPCPLNVMLTSPSRYLQLICEYSISLRYCFCGSTATGGLLDINWRETVSTWNFLQQLSQFGENVLSRIGEMPYIIGLNEGLNLLFMIKISVPVDCSRYQHNFRMLKKVPI